MLKLLLGPDWIANREYIFSLLAEDVSSCRSGRVLMVPELISHDTERRLAQIAGDTCSRFAEVLSFPRLAQRVADDVGHAAIECLDNGGRIVAMAAAARQVHQKLKAYASVETKPEFLAGLLDAVDEFKRCCISPDDLMEASRLTEGSLAQKLEELSLILEAYDGLCRQGKRDPRDRMTWLLNELLDGEYAQKHTFYIDGFPDFTRQHLNILTYLIETSENVTVSLTCDKAGSNAMAFEKAGDTALSLIHFVEKNNIPYEIVYVPSRKDALCAVRENLFQGNLPLLKDHESVFAYQTETIRQECIATAEKISDLVRNGARYRDFSIVCSDLQAYRSTLEMVFSRCRIPLYLSGTEDILEKPLVTTVITAIDAALSGFEQQEMIQYLKSSLSPISLDAADELENYVLLWGISGKKWLEQWTRHPDGLGKTETESSRRRLSRLNETRQLLVEPLETLAQGFRSANNVSDQVLSIYHFFEQVKLSKRLSYMAQRLDEQGDNRSAQILNQLWDILVDAMEQLYDVLGNMIWDADTFCRLFKLLLSQYDVGTIPSMLDAVTAGSVSAMRCQQVKHLFVLGANEGNLPGYAGSRGILTDQERVILRGIGVPLTGGSLEGLQSEFAEIYGVFCGAEETITVSCASGQPAFIYQRLHSMIGYEQRNDLTLGPALFDREEAAAFLVRFHAEDYAVELGLEEALCSLRERLNYDFGIVTRKNIEKLYGESLKLSASQIDRQAECRLYYFLRYGIRAEERKPASIDPSEFGTYVHAVLEQTVESIICLGGFRAVSLDDTLKIAMEHSENYAKTYFADIDTTRLNYLFQRNGAELSMIVKELWNEMQHCEFTPVATEVEFGDEGQVPPIDVSGRTMSAQLRGFVDRVDKWSSCGRQYIRVVDYKTGRKDFDYCDIYNGYGLQMLLYLFALENGGHSILGDHLIPAGVQYFPARVPIVSADGVLTEEEAEQQRLKLWKRKGLILADNDVIDAMDDQQEAGRLPCKRRKDGTISGDIANQTQFAVLKTFVFALVSKMVDEIASGIVAPNPYTRGTSHNACDFCPYGTVCHKDNVSGRRNYKAVSYDKFWEDVERQVKGNG